MDVFTDFFGITELNYKARNLVWKHLSLFIGVIIIYNLTSSFLFLYIINTIGIQEAGVFLAISIFLSAILDYPSGNLADKIGHKKVLASSYICFFSFFIGLVIARTFADFIILAIIQAVATSQQSGVLPSWLDSNYRHLAEAEDKEFKIYGFYKGRLYTMRSVFLPISVMIGGILADLINRQFVFLVTAISIIVFLIQIILLMRSYFPQSTSPKSSSLRSLFKNGIIFLGKDRKIFFFFSGSILQDVLWLVWFSFAMIITFGYVGTDTLLGITRTIYHISNVIVMLWATSYSKRVKTHLLPTFHFLFALFYFGGWAFLTFLFPPKNELTIIPLFISIVLFSPIAIFALTISNILSQRVQIQLVPSELRTSIYSLIPSIAGIIAALFTPLLFTIFERTNSLPIIIMILFGIQLLIVLFYILSFRMKVETN